MTLHQNVREDVLKALRSGMSLRRAADYVGYALNDIKSEMKSDALFNTEVRQAMADPEYTLLELLKSSKQWQAWKFLLQSLYPDRYYAARKAKRRPRPPEVESDEERLARLDIAQQLALQPLLAQMDEKTQTTTDPDESSQQQAAG